MLVRGRFVLVIALAAIGCGEAEPAQRGAPPPANGAQTFVGSLGRTDALVAVVQNGRDWLAYVCGGPATQAALTGWFQGRFASDTDATLEASASNGVIAAARAADEVHGSLESAGSSFSFDAERIDTGAAGVAGLFGALDSGCRTGLVVVPATATRPAMTQGVWCDSIGRVGQVTPITPLERGDRGVAVRVGEEARLLYLLPALPPLP